MQSARPKIAFSGPLRLRPSIEWTPSRLTRVRLTSEVRATYTTEDFMLPGRRSSDQSAP